MSVWNKIDRALRESTEVRVRLTPREVLVVREALLNWADGVIAEAPAWQVAQLMNEWGWPWSKKKDPSQLRSPMTGGGEKAVKSLDPKEVEVVRTLVPNAKARQGQNGQVMALPPKEWQRIKQELDAKPDYYDRMLGNQISAGGLSKKIGDELELVMGQPQKAVGLQGPEPDLSGKPDDPTPAQHGGEKFGNPDIKSIPQGSSYSKSQAASPTDDFDIDLDEPTGGGEEFTPPASAKPRRSRKKASAAVPAAAGSEEEKAARRKRVAAQDAALMGGKTKPVGRVKVK